MRYAPWMLALGSALSGACSAEAPESDPYDDVDVEARPIEYIGVYTAFDEEQTPPWDALPFSRVSLERSACFGSCPAYKIELSQGEGDETRGPAVYEGFSDLLRIGVFDGTIERGSYARLCQLLEYSRFEDLIPRSMDATVDGVVMTVSVQRGDDILTVSSVNGEGPSELIALQLSIDALNEQITWRRRPP
jgi:hypothetical protein